MRSPLLALLFVGLVLAFSYFSVLYGLGRLPGDIVIGRGNFYFYFPITTAIVVSVILSLLFWVLRR